MPDTHAPSTSTPTPVRTQVREAVASAVRRAVESGALPPAAIGPDAPNVEIERPADARHGDLASNIAMKLARACRMAPLAIATAIKSELDGAIGASPDMPIAGVDVATPGFLNLRLADSVLESTIARIRHQPETWGRVSADMPRAVNVEFVSANPTGPLHVGNARGAFVGDLLCRVLEAGGERVTREYYFNDAGAQIQKLGASVAALRRGEDVPEDGYRGAYVHELAAAVPEEILAEAATPDADEADVVRSLGGCTRPRRDRDEPRPAWRPLRRLDQ